MAACPDELWEASLWQVKREHPFVWPPRYVDGRRGSNADERERMLQAFSAFWNVAYHALFHVDFYLSGAVLKGFEPPPPFREAEHHARTLPNRPYTRDELLGYAAHDREKARAVITSLTDEQLQRSVPRRPGTFADLLLSSMTHAAEHAAQLSLFLGQNGIVMTQAQADPDARRMLVDGVRGRSDAEIDAFVKSVGGYPRLLPPVFRGLCARIMSREPATLQFDVGSSFVVRVRPDGVTSDKRVPKDVDAIVSMRPQDFLRWIVRDLDMRTALADGRVRVDGDPGVFERFYTSAAIRQPR